MALAKIKLSEVAKKLGFGYRAERVQGWGGVWYYEIRPTNHLHVSDSRFPDGMRPITYIGLFKTARDCDLQLALQLSGQTARTGSSVLNHKYWYGALYEVVV